MDRPLLSIAAGSVLFSAGCALWLISLRESVSEACFWAVAAVPPLCAPLGLALPAALCPSRGASGRLESPSLVVALGLTLAATLPLVALDNAAREPAEPAAVAAEPPPPGERAAEPNPESKAFFAACGYSLTVTVMFLFMHHVRPRARRSLQGLARRARRRLWPEVPTMRVVDRLEEALPEGAECVICLDPLADLVADLSPPAAWALAGRRRAGWRGVLRLPCQHAFHAHCMQKWLDRGEGRCPTCRAGVPGERACECILVRGSCPEAAAAAGAKAPPECPWLQPQPPAAPAPTSVATEGGPQELRPSLVPPPASELA